MIGLPDSFPRFGEDMLAEAAPLALGWARLLCRHVNHSGASCFGYHGIWQYLRFFGINTALFADADFYRAAFAPTIARGGRRVLVSGCADYATPAVVQWLFAAEGALPDLTVIDACETPLRLCDWYAARHGFAWQTHVSNILDYRPDAPFDLVCTHSFFGLFSPEARRDLVARWHDCLKPGGVFATVHRIRPGSVDLQRFGDAQARDFRDRVMREAAAREARLGVPLGDFPALTDAYIAQNTIYPVQSVDELTALMEAGGFRIASVSTRGNAGGSGLTGPTLTGGAVYAQLVAVRR